MSRGNRKAKVFHDAADYADFLALVKEACARVGVRILAYCLMPNHFHFVLRPTGDLDMGRWMHSLLTSHVQRYHRKYGTTGRVWQGRYKTFPIQEDDHLLTVTAYVERNAVRAKLVERAEAWPWGSAAVLAGAERPVWLHDGPVPRTSHWLEVLNAPETEERLLALRLSVNRGRLFGLKRWVEQTVERLGLQSTMRSAGRPRKVSVASDSVPGRGSRSRRARDRVNEACCPYDSSPASPAARPRRMPQPLRGGGGGGEEMRNVPISHLLALGL